MESLHISIDMNIITNISLVVIPCKGVTEMLTSTEEKKK